MPDVIDGPSTQDRTEIYELYARYSWALDTGDTDGYVAMFTDDAEVTEESATGETEIRKGHEAIRTLVRKLHDRPDFPGHQHGSSSAATCLEGRSRKTTARQRPCDFNPAVEAPER